MIGVAIIAIAFAIGMSDESPGRGEIGCGWMLIVFIVGVVFFYL